MADYFGLNKIESSLLSSTIDQAALKAYIKKYASVWHLDSYNSILVMVSQIKIDISSLIEIKLDVVISTGLYKVSSLDLAID